MAASVAAGALGADAASKAQAPGRRRQAVDGAAHAGRQARPPGQLEQRDADAARAPGQAGADRSPTKQADADRGSRASRSPSSAISRATRIARRRPRAATSGALPPGEPTFIERISAAGRRHGRRLQQLLARSRRRVLRIDGKPRSSIVIDPPDGRVPALTAEARTARRRADGRDARSSASSIIPSCAASPSAACCRSAPTPARRCCRTTSTTTTTRSCRPRIT